MTTVQAKLLKVGTLVEITAEQAARFDDEPDIGEVIANTGGEVVIRWADGFEGNFPHNMMEHIST